MKEFMASWTPISKYRRRWSEFRNGQRSEKRLSCSKRAVLSSTMQCLVVWSCPHQARPNKHPRKGGSGARKYSISGVCLIICYCTTETPRISLCVKNNPSLRSTCIAAGHPSAFNFCYGRFEHFEHLAMERLGPSPRSSCLLFSFFQLSIS